MSEVRLVAEERTEFGKGAARRTRRAGKIPAVLYGHGTDPKHVSLPGLEFARVVREQGRNAVLTLEIGSAGNELALTKTVTTHPLKNYIEHVDLLVVKRGEKVVVDVPVHITGDAVSGALIQQDASVVSVAADALNIPEQFEVSIDDVPVGTQILAGQIELPKGVELQTDPEALVVNVVAAPTAEEMEAELDTEGAGVVEDAPESEAAESESEGADASAEGETSDKE